MDEGLGFDPGPSYLLVPEVSSSFGKNFYRCCISFIFIDGNPGNCRLHFFVLASQLLKNENIVNLSDSFSDPDRGVQLHAALERA